MHDGQSNENPSFQSCVHTVFYIPVEWLCEALHVDFSGQNLRLGMFLLSSQVVKQKQKVFSLFCILRLCYYITHGPHLIFCDRTVYCQKIQIVLTICVATIANTEVARSRKESVLDLSENRNVGKVLLRGEGLACLRSLITNCQFLSLEILNAAPALTQHYYTNYMLLLLARLVT